MRSLSKLPELYGTWAVVTGASSGIGASFSTYLASLGFSVVLIARRIEKMEAVTAKIRASYPDVSVKVLGIDLSSSTAMQDMALGVESLDIGLVVNNAGVDLVGNFLKFEQAEHDQVMDLNVKAYTHVTHFFGRHMATRSLPKRGGMIMISSMGSSPFPYCSSYSSSKAYVTTLGLCLAEEWKPLNIDVTVIEPGPVETEMLDRSKNYVNVKELGFILMGADEIAQFSMKAFARSEKRFTPGAMNRVMQFVTNLLPGQMKISMIGNMLTKHIKAERIQYRPQTSSEY